MCFLCAIYLQANNKKRNALFYELIMYSSNTLTPILNSTLNGKNKPSISSVRGVVALRKPSTPH